MKLLGKIAVLFGLAILSNTVQASAGLNLPDALSVLPKQPKLELQQAAPNSWTILVYLHGDNNLEESSLADLEEMEAVGSKQGFNIVVQWDRASVAGGVRGVVKKGNLEVKQKLPEQNSDDPKVLSSFLQWGMKSFPAQRYGVIMWDHGGQWDGGFGGDESNGENGMNVFDMRNAIQSAMVVTGVKRLDFLAFDTCLMGGLEVLGQFADLTKLYIADPEIDYGAGWDYAASLGYLQKNPSVSLTDFGKREVSTWTAHHNEDEADLRYRAHAAYDTTQFGNVLTALKSLNTSLQADWNDESDVLSSLRSKVTEYSISPEEPKAPRPYVDLGDLASLFLAKSSSGDLRNAAKNVLSSIDKLVFAKSLGQSNKNARGLSVWMPADRSKLPDENTILAYNKLGSSVNSGWDEFLTLWFGEVEDNKDAPTLEITDTQNDVNPTEKVPTLISFKVADKDLEAVYASVGRSVNDSVFNLYGDLFYETADPGEYDTQWDGRLVYVTDGKNRSLFPGFYQETDDVVLTASALYTPPGETETQDVIIQLDSESMEFISALDDSGTSPRETELLPGGKLEFEYLQIDDTKDDYTYARTGVKIVVPKGGVTKLKAGFAKVPAGAYSVLVGASDWAGNETLEDVSVDIK
jgi:Clostripain family